MWRGHYVKGTIRETVWTSKGYVKQTPFLSPTQLKGILQPLILVLREYKYYIWNDTRVILEMYLPTLPEAPVGTVPSHVVELSGPFQDLLRSSTEGNVITFDAAISACFLALNVVSKALLRFLSLWYGMSC